MDAHHELQGPPMERTEFITIRVSPREKERLTEAAAQRGQSVTDFIVNSALELAESPSAAPLEAFRAACEARRPNYRLAAQHLMRGVRDAKPKGMSEADWRASVRKLRQVLRGDDEAAIWQWFEEHMPDTIALVPRRDNRRRKSFVAGLREARPE